MNEKEKYMKQAIKLAKDAETLGEVPVGAVIVKDGKVIAKGFNRRETTKDATRHAEMIAIQKACKKMGDWRLDGCDLYVTLEPCPMCIGACLYSRVSNVYFGAYDEKGGCCGTLYDLTVDKRFNHTLNAQGGIMQEECGKLLKDFFRKRREVKSKK
jgi:tRNA(adenine34) deaminase